MKKWILAASITIFILSLSGTSSFGQTDRTVTNTSKKGSLLIWPLVKSGPADTTLLLTNEYYEQVKLKCVYQHSFPFTHTSWTFDLMPNQTVSWLASTGAGVKAKNAYAPVKVGADQTMAPFPRPVSGTTVELRCWAVDSGGRQQIAWNWLSGEAIIKEGKGMSWAYPAWRFAVNSSTTGASAGTAGMIYMTGDTGNYDACPTGLVFNFLKQTPSTSKTFPKGTVNNVLTLVPCIENYVSNAAPAAYTGLRTYDEASSVAEPYTCVGSSNSASQWYSESLLSTKIVLPGGIPNPFSNLATPGGSIYIHGREDSHCPGSAGVPLIGVMSMQFGSGSGPIVGVPPTAIGPGQGYVRNATDSAYTSTAVFIQY